MPLNTSRYGARPEVMGLRRTFRQRALPSFPPVPLGLRRSLLYVFAPCLRPVLGFLSQIAPAARPNFISQVIEFRLKPSMKPPGQRWIPTCRTCTPKFQNLYFRLLSTNFISFYFILVALNFFWFPLNFVEWIFSQVSILACGPIAWDQIEMYYILCERTIYFILYFILLAIQARKLIR